MFILCGPINPVEIYFPSTQDNLGLPGAHLSVHFLNIPCLIAASIPHQILGLRDLEEWKGRRNKGLKLGNF